MDLITLNKLSFHLYFVLINHQENLYYYLPNTIYYSTIVSNFHLVNMKYLINQIQIFIDSKHFYNFMNIRSYFYLIVHIYD